MNRRKIIPCEQLKYLFGFPHSRLAIEKLIVKTTDVSTRGLRPRHHETRIGEPESSGVHRCPCDHCPKHQLLLLERTPSNLCGDQTASVHTECDLPPDEWLGSGIGYPRTSYH